MTSATLITALRTTAATVGDENGVRFYADPTTSIFRGWRELDDRARRIAQSLQAAGHQPGERVIVALAPGLQWPDAAYGALYAGLVLVPAPVVGYGTTGALAGRINGLAAASEASLVLTEPAILSALGEDADAIELPVRVIDDLLAGDADAWVEPGIEGDAPSFLLYTSGSTGDPKGVIGTHATFLATTETCAELFSLDSSSVLVGWAPLHHAMGLMIQVILPAVLGADSVMLATDQFQRRPIVWLQLISRHRATMSVAGNFAFGLSAKLATDAQVAELDLSSLTTLLCGSEPVRAETLDAFLTRFASTGITADAVLPAFGMTEAMLITSKRPGRPIRFTSFDAAEVAAGRLVGAEGEGSVAMVSNGQPASNTSVVIVDPDTLEPVPDGTVGEVWVSSPMVGPGYFLRPDATAETFGHRLPGSEHEYLRTGDLASVVDDELYVTGRLKEVIIVRGRNLYPQDIEATAAAVHPAVGIAAAFELDGHPSAVGIVAEYDAEALDGTTLPDLAEALRATLTQRVSLPSLAVALVEPGLLPRTPTGKVRRRPTLAAMEAGALTTSFSRGYRDTVATAH